MRWVLWKIYLPFHYLFHRLSREGRMLATTGGALALLGADVGRTDAHVLLLATAALLTASALFSWGYSLRGVQLTVRAPRRVAVGEEVTLTVRLDNEGTTARGGVRVEGPRLARDGAWTEDSASVAGLGPGERAEVTLTARFTRRGERSLGPVQAMALVPLGLGQGTPVRSAPLRLVVVPKPARVERVTTPTNRRQQPGGVSRASQVGDASEMLGVRPYRPGDQARDLHARSWARLGFPVVREYQQEYFTRVGVVLDTEKTDPARFEAALSLAAGVIARLCNGETLVDVLVCGEQVHQLTVGRSLGTLDQALDVLAGVKPSAVFRGEGVLASVGPHLEKLSSVVLVALKWDGERERLAASLRGRGVGCAVLLVGPGAAPEGRMVPVDAITRGEALVL